MGPLFVFHLFQNSIRSGNTCELGIDSPCGGTCDKFYDSEYDSLIVTLMNEWKKKPLLDLTFCISLVREIMFLSEKSQGKGQGKECKRMSV